MTTNREVYEGKILETLIKNNERLAVVEKDVKDIKEQLVKQDKKLDFLRNLLITIGLGILASLYSQPILNVLN